MSAQGLHAAVDFRFLQSLDLTNGQLTNGAAQALQVDTGKAAGCWTTKYVYIMFMCSEEHEHRGAE